MFFLLHNRVIKPVVLRFSASCSANTCWLWQSSVNKLYWKNNIANVKQEMKLFNAAYWSKKQSTMAMKRNIGNKK